MIFGLIALGIVLLVMLIMGVMYWRKRGSEFTLVGFLQSFGIDMSEGIESLMYGMRTIILLGLEFMFAHLEAQTVSEVMAYRQGSYEMGLAIALVAMVSGMTFATEIKLQFDRKQNIKPAILALKIDPKIQAEMMSLYNNKYYSSLMTIILSFILAIGMHAALVLVAMFSLQQHQLYSQMVSAGEMLPIPDMPPLHYTNWFQLPLTITSALIGSLGFIVDILLGFTSNIREELYKYKPNGEILKTASEIEAAYPGAGMPKATTTTTTGPTPKTTTGGNGSGGSPKVVPTPATTTPTTATFDPNPYIVTAKGIEDALDLDYEIGLNYTGNEATEKLLEDFYTQVTTLGMKIAIDSADLIERFLKGSANTKTSYSGSTRTMYTDIVKAEGELEKIVEELEKLDTKLDDAIQRKDDKDCKDISAKILPEISKFKTAQAAFIDKIKKFIAVIERIPTV